MILLKGSVSSTPYSSFYAIIPARSGSKGLPGKNFLRLSGLPLAEHSLIFASSLDIFDGIVLTTDCGPLLSRSKLYPDIMYHSRDPELASDTSSLIDVIFDIYDNGFIPNPGSNPAFALLQPTSPFRSVAEFSEALDYSTSCHLDSLVFVSNVVQHPSESITIGLDSWSYILPPPQGTSRRQDYLISPFFISGSLYVSTLSNLRKCSSFVDSSSSFWLSRDPYSVDIDSHFDFLLADAIYALMLSKGYALNVSSLPYAYFQ